MSISNGVKRKRPNAPGRSHLMNDESGKQSHKKKKGSSLGDLSFPTRGAGSNPACDKTKGRLSRPLFAYD